MSDLKDHDALDGIAVVGMAGRFPKARNIDEFWLTLCDGVETTTFFTDLELKEAGIDRDRLKESSYVKARAILENTEWFDASFFDYSPREAEIIDPQHRLFLECAWEALENAGYDPAILQGSIGVYAGMHNNSYLLNNLVPNHELIDLVGGLQLALGNKSDFMPTRVSYKLNLSGPSVNVQTACSTSLVAVCLACQSLQDYQSDMVLAGGVSLHFPQREGYLYHKGGPLSPDGRCRPFDSEAQGYFTGEGVGVVALKRLEDAVADRDYIYAVIKGSAINNDGSAKASFAAPGVGGQTEAIAMAHAVAEIEAETITYVEAHGTGTPLGDAIEIASLTKAFRLSTEGKGYCAVGSVKANIGNLDEAGGIAGFIKTVLALHHKLLPPSPHFEQPNPNIDFEHSPFYVNTTLTEWKPGKTPRRAGVNAYAIGGTNAHVILEEAAPIHSSASSRPCQLLTLSAKTDTALQTMTENLVEHLTENPELNLADVAYTLQVGRRAFDHRRILVCCDADDAVDSLQMLDPQRVFTHVWESNSRAPTVIFMFTGDGSQYVNMGRQLYQVESTFREQVDLCAEFLKPHLGLDLRGVLYPSVSEAGAATQPLDQTSIAQPALFAIEHALAKLLIAWGVHPQAMIGHGIGEYVAACLAEVFTLEEALVLVATRGRLLQQLPGGAVPAVSLTEQALALNPPRIPFVSNVSGTWITAAEATDPGYWATHLHQTVRFAEGLAEILSRPDRILLEVGPGQKLSSLAEQHSNRSARQVVLSSLRPAHDPQSDLEYLLNTVGRLWLSHVTVNWSGLYTEKKRYRVPLPTYPFERQRYWVEPQKQTAEPKAEKQDLTKKPNIDDWFYVPSWKRGDLLKLPDQITPTSRKLIWLVFLDNCGVGPKLVERLKQCGQNVTSVLPGKGFRQVKEDTYAISPQESEDYGALFTRIRALNKKAPDRIVHLWNVTPDEHASSDLTFLQESQYLGFYSLLFLVQALNQHRITDPVRIHVISNNMQEVTGNEGLCPEKATVLGLCRVIPQEFLYIKCRSTDIVWPASGKRPRERVIGQLLVELVTESSDPVVAHRGHYRWIQTFEPARLDESFKEVPRLREGGVYLVLGGLGDIGLVLAKHLAQSVKAKLVLTGRSALPARAEWPKWLETHDDEDRVSIRIQSVQDLEDMGAEVLTLRADAADEKQMQQAMAQIYERFGQLNGVIHAAGAVTMVPLQDIGRTEFEQQFLPKGQGLIVLEKVLQGKSLDFCLLTSSLSSVLGGLGFSAYSAANLFMDSFSYKHNRTSAMPWTSVNWDSWRLTEATEQGTSLGATLAELSLDPEEGIEVFRRILSVAGSTQIIVSTGDLQTRIDRWVKLDLLRDSKATNQVESLPHHPRPNLQNTYSAPRSELEQRIAHIWQELLGVEQVGIHDDFFDLGGSSVVALRLFDQIERRFDKRLPLATLFEATTVAELAIAVGDGEDPSVSWSSLVPIRGSGSKPPFFVIHAAGGNILRYRDLVRHLGPDQPVYGLQSQGLDGKQPLLTSVEEMAALYLKEIRQAQPKGPYLLGGYCLGGTISYELAQQLQSQGQEVALLVLFETYNWANIRTLSLLDHVHFVLQKVVFHWHNFGLLSAKEKQTFLVEKMIMARHRSKVWYGRILSRLGRKTSERNVQHLILGRLWKTNDDAAVRYRPTTYPGRVTLFRPQKEYALYQDPSLAWDRLALGGVETHTLPVYPAGMLVEPFAAQTAEVLRACIDQALETTAMSSDNDSGQQRSDVVAQVPTDAMEA